MATHAYTKTGEGLLKPTRIVPWPYDASLSRPQITPGGARAEASYAQQMHDTAMRGQLNDFINQPKVTQ